MVPVVHDPDDGSILDVGRRTRSIPPALRRALEVRDRGCRFPGCGLGFTDAHHVVHWADGGETSLENTLLLCRHHHRLVHEGGWTVGWWGEGRPVFHGPRGQTLCDGSWTMPKLEHADPGESAEGDSQAGDALSARARGHDIDPPPDGWTAAARWPRDADIPAGVLFGVLEALS